ncbi:SBBP repeat-containing protein [Chryseobacterium bernardetii]|uniref:SBBP repeat-containing protein n=1 Tax=Chryseobacterium bernardetii TaxID=1241978 RepID=UPI00162AB57F|nr:SBBP repeat-containing protein [Chryseobacterium bernardetii]
MKKLTLLFVIIFLPFIAYSQQSYLPDYNWGGNIGGTGYDRADHIMTDLYGNVIVAGKFSANTDFGISTPATSISSSGSSDAYVAKYSEQGALIWVKTFASNTSYDDAPYINSTAMDYSGNIYLTGYFTGTIDFDPSPTGVKLLTSNGDADIFIAKLDRNGILVWAGNIGGAEYDRGFGITVDNQDRIYVTGSFRTTADFDITPGVFNLTSEYIDTTFIIKLDKNANIIWGKATQGNGSDVGMSVAVDSAYNVFVTGRNLGTTDFDPSPTSSFILSNSFAGQAYLMKLDSNGNFLNAGATSSANQNHAATPQKIKIDSNNNIIIAGSFYGTADFNFGTGNNPMTSYGTFQPNDAFVLKVDNNLNYLWATKLGAEFDDGAYGLAIDQNNNILTTGYFRGIIINDYSGRYGEEVFVWALDPAGNQIGLDDYIGPGSGDQGNDITVDKSGNIYVAGMFYTSLKNSTIFNYPSAGNSDGFVVKLGNIANPAPTDLPPTAIEDFYTQSGNTSSYTLNVLANDQGLSGAQLIKIVSYPLYGTLNVNSNGTIVYTPNVSTPMNDSFSYTVENGNGMVSNVAKVNIINSGSLSVKEAEVGQKIALYPNPADAVVHLMSDSKIMAVQILDMSGKKLLEANGTNKIDVSMLSSGVYLLSAKTQSGEILRQTFIKK